jgi:ribA/ribD-fused uncharacterized protein
MPPKRKNARTIQTKTPKTPSPTVFFYHPDEKPYGVFCQWKPSHITIPTHILQRVVNKPSTPGILASHGQSITFGCAEQSYMFCKALYFGDGGSCKRIMETSDPSKQKKLGKEVEGFSNVEWDGVKSRVARVVNWYKFTNEGNRHMRDILLGTGERELAEAGRRDRIWGIGYQAHEAERYRGCWGENRLGRCLMAVRVRIGECAVRERDTGVPEGWDWDGGVEDEVTEEEIRVWNMRQDDEEAVDEE